MLYKLKWNEYSESNKHTPQTSEAVIGLYK